MRTRSFALFCIAVVLTTGSAAYAANCALRNPDRQIYEMFPEATNYRSLVGKVDVSLKGTIEGKAGSSLTLTRISDLAPLTARVYTLTRRSATISPPERGGG